MEAADARAAMRAGRLDGPTAGLAHGFAQANIAIVPARLADDFAAFCRANARACPLLAVSPSPGDPSLPDLGDGIDIRSDLPRYRVWRDGAWQPVEPGDVRRDWRDDLVTHAVGCSFTFETALADAGLAPRHVTERRNVAMYRTAIDTVRAGPFGGKLVVSMRAYAAADIDRVVAITGRFPTMHGAPVHVGDPASIGIADISRPEFGDAPSLRPGDVPLFWACGVTSQAAIEAANPDLAITHAPGRMLVTDRLHTDYEKA